MLGGGGTIKSGWLFFHELRHKVEVKMLQVPRNVTYWMKVHL